MEITGKIIAVLPPKQGVSQSTGNAWMCQDYVLETQEMYPKKVCFNVFGAEKIQEMNIQLGEMLTVSLERNANEYQGRLDTQVRGGKVVRGPAQGQGQQQTAEQAPWPQAGLTPPAQAQAQPQGQAPAQDDGQLPF